MAKYRVREHRGSGAQIVVGKNLTAERAQEMARNKQQKVSKGSSVHYTVERKR